MSSHLKEADRFAKALDREEYAAAGACLAADCEYHIRGVLHRGPGAILDAYRQAGAWAASHLEAIHYESAARADEAGGAVVTFTDHLEHRGQRFTHRCEQHLTFDQEGRIRRIEHRDLPGQREALAAFLATLGLDPRDPASGS